MNQPPHPPSVTLRRLTEADVGAADAIFRSAFGAAESRTVELRRYLALQPDGWLLALSDETPVGMVGAVDYGPFAYIGMLAVHPAAQRRGIGQALMRRLLTRLDARGTPLALLDATAAGAPVYLRLGFVETDQTVVYQLALPPRPTALPERVRVLGPADASALSEFDVPIFGADRTDVFRALLTELPGRAFTVHDDAGVPSGYLFAQGRRLGPWVAPRPQDAETLLQAALTLPYETAPVVLVPQSNRAAAGLLEHAGFERQHFTRHMQRGNDISPIQRARIHGLASFALG